MCLASCQYSAGIFVPKKKESSDCCIDHKKAFWQEAGSAATPNVIGRSITLGRNCRTQSSASCRICQPAMVRCESHRRKFWTTKTIFSFREFSYERMMRGNGFSAGNWPNEAGGITLETGCAARATVARTGLPCAITRTRSIARPAPSVQNASTGCDGKTFAPAFRDAFAAVLCFVLLIALQQRRESFAGPL